MSQTPFHYHVRARSLWEGTEIKNIIDFTERKIAIAIKEKITSTRDKKQAQRLLAEYAKGNIAVAWNGWSICKKPVANLDKIPAFDEPKTC